MIDKWAVARELAAHVAANISTYYEVLDIGCGWRYTPKRARWDILKPQSVCFADEAPLSAGETRWSMVPPRFEIALAALRGRERDALLAALSAGIREGLQ